MEKFKQYLLATAGLAILVGGLTLLGPAVPQGQAVPPAKDVNVVNTPLSVNLATTANVNIVNDANNPVPVTVQNGANDDGQPFEFSGNVQNSSGTVPSCITPTDLFTVPTGERFIVTDVVVSSISLTVIPQIIVDITRDQASIFPIQLLSSGSSLFSHAFQTGLAFEEGETLRVSLTNFCDPKSAIVLVTGIRTTS